MVQFEVARLGLAGAIVSLLLVGGCGGGGGTGDTAPEPGAAGVVSGVVTKGPVGNASVTAYGMAGGQVGGPLGTAMTDADGHFRLSIGTYGGPVMLRATGGSYRDEATGLSMGMAPGDAMTAVVPDIAAAAQAGAIQVTPLTAMAQAMAQQMAGGLTAANIATANTALGSYFLVRDILHTQPMNPLAPGAGTGASQDARAYGMTLAAMSQSARTLDMPFSSALVTAMMDDASDRVMDGRRAGSRISMSMGGMMVTRTMVPGSGTSSLATAMADFMASSANVSGLALADMAALMQKLNNSDGKI